MRKVYITGVPAFGNDVDYGDYVPIGACWLSECKHVGYPVAMVMEGTINDKEKDEYAVIAVDTGGQTTSRHMDCMEKELKERGFKGEFVRVQSQSSRSGETPKELMMGILNNIRKDDDLYISIEFGAKPIQAAILYGTEIAERAFEDLEIRGIFYGEKAWNEPGKYYMQDVSILYRFSKIAEDIDVENEEELIDTLDELFSLMGE